MRASGLRGGLLLALLGVWYATNASGAWARQSIGTAEAGTSTTLALDRSGAPYVIYGGGTYRDGRLARRLEAGWRSVPLEFDTDSTPGFAHLLALDAVDAMHVVFWDGGGDVYYATNRARAPDPGAGDGIDQDCDGLDG